VFAVRALYFQDNPLPQSRVVASQPAVGL
jgi:hypothetical protein